MAKSLGVTVINASTNQDIDGVLWGWRWTVTSLSYSFPTSDAEYLSGATPGVDRYVAVNSFAAFNTEQQTAARNVLANAASFANLTFTETTNADATLRYGNVTQINYTNDSSVSQYTGLHFPGNPPAPGTAEANPPEAGFGGAAPYSAPFAQGDNWFANGGYTNPVLGGFEYAAGIMHETGHNLGLKHGHITQDGHGYTFPMLPADHDSFEYSIMTYMAFPGAPVDFINAADFPTTYMQDDIAALQHMYGANYGPTSHNGDDVYTWSATTGEAFIDGQGQGAPYENFVFMTVWDGGGIDTYDLSNFTTAMEINLRAGQWTIFDTSANHLQRANLGNNHVGGLDQFARGNVANAQIDPNDPNEVLSLIENAFGGSANDTIFGNKIANMLQGRAGDDTLTGGAGNDTLYGGSPSGAAGVDTAVYSGNQSDYAITELAGGGLVVEDLRAGSPDGTDTLYNISNLEFADTTIPDDFTANTLTTGSVAVSGSAAGAVTFGGDRDWFAVSLAAGASYIIREGAGTLAAPLLRIYDPLGTLLASHDSRIIFTPDSSGTYYVDAGAANGGFTGTYSVGVTAFFNDAQYADFGGGARSDLLFRNSAGQIQVWYTDDSGVLRGTSLLGSTSPDWHVLAASGFNAVRAAEIAFHNDDGRIAIWRTDGQQIQSIQTIGSVSAAWHVAGVGDLNGDGSNDLLFRNSGTGEIASWLVDGDGIQSIKALGSVSLSDRIVAVGDFNGDGTSDVLFRNSATGDMAIWEIKDNAIQSIQMLGSTAADWHVVGTGDFNGDSRLDILFRNDLSGQVAEWLLNGPTIQSIQAVGSAGLQLFLQGTGDVNGDGTTDIIFSNSANPNANEIAEWLMKDGNIQTVQALGTAPADYALAGHHFDVA